MMFDWNDTNCGETKSNEECVPLDPYPCHPELMTKTQLIKLLKERNLYEFKDESIDGYESYDYINLIELYNNVLLPLPQRNYGNHRKTRLNLQTKQIECNKRMDNKRKIEDLETNSDHLNNLKSKLNTNNNNNNYIINEKQILQKNDNKRQRISFP